MLSRLTCQLEVAHGCCATHRHAVHADCCHKQGQAARERGQLSGRQSVVAGLLPLPQPQLALFPAAECIYDAAPADSQTVPTPRTHLHIDLDTGGHRRGEYERVLSGRDDPSCIRPCAHLLREYASL